MPRKPGAIGRPADNFVAGKFPDGRLRAGAPVGVVEVATVARRLRSRLRDEGIPIAVFAETAGVDRTTVHALLAGRAFIDVVTLARLERAAGVRLWPDDR